MKRMNEAIKYEAPRAVILTPSDELLDRESLNIDGGSPDAEDTLDIDIDIDYGEFWP